MLKTIQLSCQIPRDNWCKMECDRNKMKTCWIDLYLNFFKVARLLSRSVNLPFDVSKNENKTASFSI